MRQRLGSVALAAALDAWAEEREATAASSDEIARLRAELAELRNRVRTEPARLRGSVAAAGAQAHAELADLRRTLRERTRELRGAERERDVDDARLWLLVDTLVQAAAGVRRELSLSAPSVRPSGRRRRIRRRGGYRA